MAKLMAFALVLALVSLLLLNYSAYATDVAFEDAKQHMDQATAAAGQVAVDAVDKAQIAAHEAGKSWSSWFGGVFGGQKPTQQAGPATLNNPDGTNA